MRVPAKEDVMTVTVEEQLRKAHENLYYLSQAYCMTMNYIHTTTRGTIICLQSTVPCGGNFANGYYVNTPRMSSFYITFCGQTKRACVLACEGVFIAHSNHFWARDNRERGCQMHFSSRVWVGIIGDIFVGRCLLPDGMIEQRYCDFLETSLPRLFEDLPLAVRQRWGFSMTAPAHCGEDIQQ